MPYGWLFSRFTFDGTNTLSHTHRATSAHTHTHCARQEESEQESRMHSRCGGKQQRRSGEWGIFGLWWCGPQSKRERTYYFEWHSTSIHSTSTHLASHLSIHLSIHFTFYVHGVRARKYRVCVCVCWTETVPLYVCRIYARCNQIVEIVSIHSRYI